MAVREHSTTARVIAEITVELDQPWSDDVPISEIRKRAISEAKERIASVINRTNGSGLHSVNVVEVSIITRERK